MWDDRNRPKGDAGQQNHDREVRWPPNKYVREYPRTYGRESERDHDDGLRKSYREVTKEIEMHGGKILWTRSEIDLKAEMGKTIGGLGRIMTRDEQLEMAEALGLPIVSGRIRIPDVQMMVERKTGDRELVNFEYASKHYHRKAIVTKREAGFAMRSSSGASWVLGRKVKDGPEMVRNIMGR
jgi:hypothetical protein